MHLSSCDCSECVALRGEGQIKVDGTILPRRWRMRNGVMVRDDAPIPDTLREMVESQP